MRTLLENFILNRLAVWGANREYVRKSLPKSDTGDRGFARLHCLLPLPSWEREGQGRAGTASMGIAETENPSMLCLSGTVTASYRGKEL